MRRRYLEKGAKGKGEPRGEVAVADTSSTTATLGPSSAEVKPVASGFSCASVQYTLGLPHERRL